MKKHLRRPLIYAVFAAATVLGLALGGPSRVLAGPDQCERNCQNQHCPRGACSDDQHQKRLNACLKKCS